MDWNLGRLASDRLCIGGIMGGSARGEWSTQVEDRASHLDDGVAVRKKMRGGR